MCLPFICLAISSAIANESSPKTNIDAYIETQLQQSFPEVHKNDLSFTVNYPKSLLDDKKCATALAYDWRGNLTAGANTLNVSCSEPQWQAYLPVSIQVFKWVLVARQPLSRNKTLTPAQLDSKRLDIGSLRSGFFTEAEKLAGYQIQRTVQTGQVITPYIVKAPYLVKRGDWVTIISGKGALTVKTTGEALKTGQLGEQILVKNLRTEQKIKAWIIKKGVVTTKKDLL